MPAESEFFTTFEALPPGGRVHIVGAGPVGLLLAALLQSVEDVDVRLYEKRREYTRGRMVQLEPFLTAESIEEYCTDPIDGDNVEAVFDPLDLYEAMEFRRSVPSDLMELLRGLSQGFCPLNAIEQSLSDLIDSRSSDSVQRITAAVTPEDALALLEPGDMLIDCSGSNSVLRDRLVPSSPGTDAGDNTHTIRLEHALVVTFLYGQAYDCNEYCKYYKNAGNDRYKFIPSVHRTYSDGNVTHVTGIVTISEDEFAAMPPRFDGVWLRENFPDVAESMDRFIEKIKDETHGELLGELEIIRIPLNLYRARNATSRPWHLAGPFHHPFASTPVFLLGDSAIGSPYFQSISLGFESAMFLARLISIRDLPMQEMFDRYERYVYQQWLRVYMRSKVIKHNKDLLECVDDRDAVLEKLHLYWPIPSAAAARIVTHMDLQRIPADAPTELITGALERDGAVIVEDLLDADLLARFNAELDPFIEDAPLAQDREFINAAVQWFFGAQTRDVTGVAGRSRVFATEILTHPVYRSVCDEVLLPSCASYQLNIAHVLDRGPGSEQQLIHRDELVWVHLPKPHGEVQLASVIALVDFTADNGATRVAPGSHRWEPDRIATEDELVPAEMAAGSAIVYLGSTLHGGGANVTTDQRRRGMHVSYCVGWLRTEENQYLSTPIEVVRTLPPESQALLGYASHDALAAGGGYLGSVRVQDPVALLAAGEL